jgi:hypothetical protein
MEEIALKAAHAVGGEILGVDLVETEEGLKVIEINTGAEFKGLVEATGVDVPAAIVDYLCRRAKDPEIIDREKRQRLLAIENDLTPERLEEMRRDRTFANEGDVS